MINGNAAFDKYQVARLGETVDTRGDGDGFLELHRMRGDHYALSVFWRNDDLTFHMTKAEVKALGQALARLADVTFIDGE